jgi:CRISPR-associated protein Cas6/Cse3/CasE subtype I-E
MYKFVTRDIKLHGMDVNEHHKEILKHFPFDEGAVRYRVDGDQLTILCPYIPKINIKSSLNSIPEYSIGDKLKFRTRLVAVKRTRKNTRGKKKGEFLPLVGIRDLIPWFKFRADRNGFEVIDWSKIIPEGPIPCNHETGHYIYNSVEFEGTLQVKDKELFNKVVVNGIGDGKSFGFGVFEILE